MALDHRGGIAADRHGLDHVGIKRALREKLRLARAFGRRLKNFDERLADDLAFALRVGHAFEPFQKKFRGVFVLQLDLEMAAKNFLHDFRLARARSRPLLTKMQVSWSPMALCSSAAATLESTPPLKPRMTRSVADLRANFLDGLVNVIAHRPVFAAAADAVDEVGDDFPAARRVRRLRDGIAGRKISARGFRWRRIRSFP